MNREAVNRCAWPGDDLLMLRYHDDEWGVPVHDDHKWFEFIILDAFQAGLAWKTVLHKHKAFHKVFYGFDPQRVAEMSDTISKALKQQGFSFVGSTICYALLQAAGVVNDHRVGCFRYHELTDKGTP